MGFFSNEPSLPPNAKVTPRDLEQAIDKIPHWDNTKREFVKAMFHDHGRGGTTPGWVTPREFDEALREMERNLKDPIDSLRISHLRELKRNLFSPPKASPMPHTSSKK